MESEMKIKNNKYFVVAKKYDEGEEKIVKCVVGEFDRHINAVLFRDAYNKHYSANAVIINLNEI